MVAALERKMFAESMTIQLAHLFFFLSFAPIDLISSSSGLRESPRFPFLELLLPIESDSNPLVRSAQNVTSSSTVIAALEGARDVNAPVILQVSQGGAAFFGGKSLKNDKQQGSIAGAVAAAHYIRAIAPAYGM